MNDTREVAGTAGGDIRISTKRVGTGRHTPADRGAFAAALWYFGIANRGPADILYLLLNRRGRLVSRKELADQLDVSETTISVYMSTLRLHLARLGLNMVVETVRLHGFRISAECATIIADKIGFTTEAATAETKYTTGGSLIPVRY